MELLIKNIIGLVLVMLLTNLLGMYNAKQWFTYDKEKAIQGLKKTFLIALVLALLSAIALYFIPQITIDGESVGVIETLSGAIFALSVERFVKAFKQILSIFQSPMDNPENAQ